MSSEKRGGGRGAKGCQVDEEVIAELLPDLGDSNKREVKHYGGGPYRHN